MRSEAKTNLSFPEYMDMVNGTDVLELVNGTKRFNKAFWVKKEYV